MDISHGKMLPIRIEDEMQKSYIDYARRIKTGASANSLCDARSRHGLKQAAQEIGPYRR